MLCPSGSFAEPLKFNTRPSHTFAPASGQAIAGWGGLFGTAVVDVVVVVVDVVVGGAVVEVVGATVVVVVATVEVVVAAVVVVT